MKWQVDIEKKGKQTHVSDLTPVDGSKPLQQGFLSYNLWLYCFIWNSRTSRVISYSHSQTKTQNHYQHFFLSTLNFILFWKTDFYLTEREGETEREWGLPTPDSLPKWTQWPEVSWFEPGTSSFFQVSPVCAGTKDLVFLCCLLSTKTETNVLELSLKSVGPSASSHLALHLPGPGIRPHEVFPSVLVAIPWPDLIWHPFVFSQSYFIYSAAQHLGYTPCLLAVISLQWASSTKEGSTGSW